MLIDRSFKADLDVHSSFSDGKLSIPEIVDLYGALGFGAIAITDRICETRTVHGKTAVLRNRTLTPATFPLYAEILKSEAVRAWERYRMVLIPGMTLVKKQVVKGKSARVLALGVTKYLDPSGDPAEVAARIRGEGGFAIAGYGSGALSAGNEELIEAFDAWQAAHGKRIQRSLARSDLACVAGSGLRKQKDLPSWKVEMTCDRDAQAIFQSIRERAVRLTFFRGYA